MENYLGRYWREYNDWYRLKRVYKDIDDDHFCLTYGDGLADINIDNLINSHFKSGKEAIITAVKPLDVLVL